MPTDYVQNYQDSIVDAFLKTIAASKQYNKYHTDIKTLIENSRGTIEIKDSYELYENIWKKHQPDDQQALVALYAKITDLTRRARKISNNSVVFVNMHDEEMEKREEKEQEEKQGTERFTTADVFDYTFKKCEEQKVDEKILQESINSNGVASVSITMHPTNPTSVEYTKAAMELEEVLTSKNSTKKALEEKLKTVLSTPITSKKKTQMEEVEETLLFLRNIYNQPKILKDRLLNAARKHDYKNIEIGDDVKLLDICIWATGDGDGNDNATEQSLRQAIERLKKEIKELYQQDINKIDSLKNITIEDYKTPEDFLAFLKENENASQDKEKIDALIEKVKNFGFHFARIDIRHNANDLAYVFNNLLSEKQVKAYNKCKDDYEKTKFITALFDNIEFIQNINSINTNDIKDERTRRIFGRLRAIAEHPEMSDKLIIAECKGAKDALTAMLLLKLAGHKLDTTNKMNIVPLTESVDDLNKLEDTLRALLDNEIFRNHIIKTGKLILMIAKSDTVRRDGRGSEEIQEEALGKAYKILEEYKKKCPELEHVKLCGFNAGGAALQRGGGRMEEVPYNQARYAARHKAQDMGHSIMTVQGHQSQILFSPDKKAANFLEAIISQNIYGHLRVTKELAGREDVDEEKAVQNYSEISKKARETYRKYVGNPEDKENAPGNPAFNLLFKKAPWIAVYLDNVSSRPAKRGQTEKTAGQTAGALKGKKIDLLDNRAITVERICAHSGTHFLTYLSCLEGLEQSAAKTLHETYDGSKSFRDWIRITALALHMTDFNHAWYMMIGEGENRPGTEELQKLAEVFEKEKFFTTEKYEETYGKDCFNNPKFVKELNIRTLAWIEVYANKTAAKVYEAVFGKEPEKPITHQLPVQEKWPNLAKQMVYRENQAEFARFALAKITNDLDENPNKIVDENLFTTIQAIYTAADVTNAPVGAGASTTRSKVDQSMIYKYPANKLFLPNCLTEYLSERSNQLGSPSVNCTFCSII